MELLIKAVDATSTDPEMDRGLSKRGDVIVLFDDGHGWGTLELLPPAQGGKFVRLVITGVTVAQFKAFIKRKWGINPDDPEWETVNIDGRVAQKMVLKRRLHLRLADLPANVRNQLNTNGVFTTTWAALREYVREKVSNSTAQGESL